MEIGNLYVVNTTGADTAYTPENTGRPTTSVSTPATAPASTAATMLATSPAAAPAASPATSVSMSMKRRRSTIKVRQTASAPKTIASATAKPYPNQVYGIAELRINTCGTAALIDTFAHDDTMYDVPVQAKHK